MPPHPSTSLCRRLHPGLRLDQLVAAGAGSPGAAGGGKEEEEQLPALIADVLRQHKQEQQEQRGAAAGDDGAAAASLFDLLDRSGAGVAPVVTRTWDTNAVRVTLEGSFAPGGAAAAGSRADARRVAMLAVYQEHMVLRAAAVRRALDEVTSRLAPGLVPQEDVDAALAAEATNFINGAVDALGGPQLTLLASALVPLAGLVAAVEAAVDEARRVLLARVRGRERASGQ